MHSQTMTINVLLQLYEKKRRKKIKPNYSKSNSKTHIKYLNTNNMYACTHIMYKRTLSLLRICTLTYYSLSLSLSHTHTQSLSLSHMLQKLTLLVVLMTRCTVRPSLMPCCSRWSGSFRIFPAKIRHSCSTGDPKRAATSSFS